MPRLRPDPSGAPLQLGESARCERCGATMVRARTNPIDRSLAFVIAAIAMFGLALFTPFLSISMSGQEVSAEIVTGSIELDLQGFWELGLLVAITTLFAPVIRLASSTYVLLALRLPRPPHHLAAVFRWNILLRPWSMIEVYLIAVFVAYAKLIDLAQIEIGIAMFAFAAVMVTMSAADMALEPDAVWAAIDRREHAHRTLPVDVNSAHLVGCECCGLVSEAADHDAHCPRCGAPLHHRKPDSLARTWALVIAAIILYIPANVYPVMTVVSLGNKMPATILGGVVELIQAGMWPLALLVFFASVTVPVLKLLGLIALLISTYRGRSHGLRDRSRLYRIIEVIGRWSMIDVFMISILVGVVRLGNIATIEPGLGAVSFAGVVIVTMIAAECFDPRLMWDAAGQNPHAAARTAHAEDPNTPTLALNGHAYD
ncbi:paraquat-inducible protein A [Segnochrobactrum spirostomi]|uniref:Paraquat-inducible protein A n=1 Tax=Segnochrobactrum spirostomi TaxID=2608987 RepID=A0A6A7XZI1_9HYPH|nr:paraquat-inducible protein A [Segnochrobactrum spirostomi]MQT11726.1 paraquat-inducible protein A [Segnochrobactrum spirostomi]